MTVAAGVLVSLWLAPPFMVIDGASAGARHAPLGHRPFWSPPTREAAAEVLAREFGAPATDDLTALRIGRNDVRLAMETVCVLAVAGVLGWATRRRARRGG